MSLGPGVRIGVYDVTERLGAGGMGEVYRATDTRLKRDVALKVLPADVSGDPARMARFQREAELLASLNHPNIAQVHGLEESGGAVALAMELVEGEDLARRIARGPLRPTEALRIANQIAAALEAAHDQGIVHRDLKPGNIMVRPDGVVKVLDFGLAKSVAPSAAGTPTMTSLSMPGLPIGTPAYMSPEQARGEAAGRESDIWAFGLVLYEMLTGVSPFARPGAADTLAQVLTAPVDDLPLPEATPAPVRRIVRRCLDREPKRRWRHIGDIRVEIEDALAAPGDSRPGMPTAAPARVTRRTLLGYGAASLAALAGGVGSGVWLERRSRSALTPSFRRLTFRRGLIRSARFAPDGQTILYGALWEGDRCRVHTVRVDSPESEPLDLPDANLLAVSRQGELALALGPHDNGIITYGTLARVPMAGRAPREVLENVKAADWSPDGNELAVVRMVDGRDQLQYPIGTTLVAPGVGEHTGLAFARVSPDGRRVAFVHYQSPSSLAGRVAIADRSGAVTHLSPPYLNIHGLTWSGDEIVFTAADERPLFRALLAVRPGEAPRTITRMPSNTTVWDALPDGRLITAQTDDRAVMFAHIEGDEGRDLSWLDASWLEDLSRDGTRVLFTEYGQGGGPDSAVYLRGTDGSAAVRLGAGRAVALSPDGRWAIAVEGYGPSPYLEILPTGPGEPRRVTGNGLAYLSAAWLPDGGRLIVSASEPGRRARLYLFDLASDRRTPLTPEGITGWAVSPDGSTIAARGPDTLIRLYGLDGSASREIPGLTGHEAPVGWVTDGLLVGRNGDPSAPLGQIYRLDPVSGRQEPWRNILPRDRAGIMGQLSFRTTPDGRAYAYAWHRASSSLYVAEGLR